jgi:predicted GTPase
MMSDEQELHSTEHSIQWCLLSHTNIGKTTLTRTLMADDVGEIEDAAHVTSQSQRYLLQKTQQGDELWLWDTPGFGDSVRLYERLRQQGNPLGWFLSNVWDRWRDKPFYLSQRALLAARDHADVMLYLVNAAEDPADAGYWSAEMNILAWLEKPVIVLLNQIGGDTTQEQAAQDLQRWKQATQGFRNVVRDVLVLDAFTRSWWHERRMMQSIAPLLPAAKQEAYQRLLLQREQQQQQREQASLQVMADQLQAAAGLHESLDPEQGKLLARAWQGLSQLTSKLSKSSAADDRLSTQARAAVERLMMDLRQSDVQATQRLLEIHQLDGQAASQIQEQLRSQLKISKPVDAQAASLWGAVTAGAATGLGADLVAGGLTLGTGALVGALVGALTFGGAAWGANKMFDQEQQSFQLSQDYLTGLASQVLLKYLLISHFGRGRGRYTSPAAPKQWSGVVQAVVQSQAGQWAGIWESLRSEVREGNSVNMHQRMQQQLEQDLQQVMTRLYPDLQVALNNVESAR